MTGELLRSRQPSRRVRLAIAVSLGGLLTACGTLGGDLPSEWVASDSDGAIYLSWTARDPGGDSQDLTGIIHQATLTGGRVEATQVSFTGVRTRSALTLTLGGFLGIGRTITGTVDRERLTLRIPGGDASLEEAVLIPGGIDAYNRALDRLREEAARQASLEQQRAAEEAARRKEAEQAAADLRNREEAFREAVSYLDQSYGEVESNLDGIGWLLEDASFMVGSLTGLVNDMEQLVVEGPVDQYLQDAVRSYLEAVADTRTSVEVLIDDAFSSYPVGPILETLSGDAAYLEETARALRGAGGDPEALWPGWRDLASSVGQRVSSSGSRMSALVEEAGEVEAAADAQVERARGIAESIGVDS